jgi:serine protease Do
MKQYFIKGIAVAGIILLTVPAAFAQKEKDKEDKNKESKEMQHINITRKGNLDEKTVIEIKGDKVTINGKDAKDVEGVNVNVNKIRDYRALAPGARAGTRIYRGNNDHDNDFNFDFDFDGDRVSLFHEDANRAMLGVTPDEDDKGAKITSVVEGSAAAKAGLKKGDIITKIDNEKVKEADDVSRLIRSKKPGDKVSITYLRDGKEQKQNVELGKWKGAVMPNLPAIAPGQWNADFPRIESLPGGQGFVISGGAPKLGLSIQDTDDGKGVKVLEVDEDSNAAKAGLKEGDVITRVNDKDVNSTDEVTRIVRENRSKPSMQFQVQRAGKTQTIEVRTPRKLKTADL